MLVTEASKFALDYGVRGEIAIAHVRFPVTAFMEIAVYGCLVWIQVDLHAFCACWAVQCEDMGVISFIPIPPQFTTEQRVWLPRE